MNSKKCLLAVFAIMVMGSLIFCSPVSTVTLAAEPSKPIKIGALLPLTGALLPQGPKARFGIEMALEDAGWQAAGRKIELIVEDSATDPTTALDKARKLVERDKVIAIIGPNHSGVANAIQPYMNKNKVISMKVMQFPKPLIAKYPWLIVLNGTQQQTCAPMGWYAYEKLGFRKVTTMGPDYIAGRAFVGGFMDGFKEKGGEIVQEQWFPMGNVDFAPYFSALKPADACSAWVAGAGALRLVTQYHDYGVSKKMPLIGAFASNLMDEDKLPQLGDISLGILGPSAYASTLDYPLNDRVVARWKQRYGSRPGDTLAIGGYQNAQVLVEGIKAAGGDTSPEKLRQAILNLRIQTPCGPLRFTPEGAGIFNIYIVKNAKVKGEYLWQVVHTYTDTRPR
ncbi:MAG: ABC transporter substrate-binding protein [Deltaproteobacteria bacterium]|nr:MAG: ABC transporter substrate-binding protein [Deltaproteobacteria bacterium]